MFGGHDDVCPREGKGRFEGFYDTVPKERIIGCIHDEVLTGLVAQRWN